MNQEIVKRIVVQAYDNTPVASTGRSFIDGFHAQIVHLVVKKCAEMAYAHAVSKSIEPLDMKIRKHFGVEV